jgi:hypothetical protein
MKETILSIIRHALSILGGVLLAKGYINDAVAAWLPGALFALTGAIWGAFDELGATGGRRDFWMSVIRHVLGAAGGYFATLGKLSLESVETIVGVIMSVIAAIWGPADEAVYAAGHPPSE